MSKEVVLGARELRRKIDAIRKEIPSILGRERLAPFLLRRVRARFIDEKDPDLKPWAPLSPMTRPSDRILSKTGNLFKSIDVVGADRGGFASATRFGFRIGIKSRKYTEQYVSGGSRTVDTAVYGRVHQLGNSTTPRRRFIGLSTTDIRAVSDLIRRELSRATKGTT